MATLGQHIRWVSAGVGGSGCSLDPREEGRGQDRGGGGGGAWQLWGGRVAGDARIN